MANGVVYVGSGGKLYVLDASTGALLWSYATRDNVDNYPADVLYSSPAVANGVVYLASGHKLYAFGLKKGRK